MNYLDEIIERKRQEVNNRSTAMDLSGTFSTIKICRTNVLGALRKPGKINVIAEHKRRSPSKGDIRPDSDPVAVTQSYEKAGAAAVSVLTDTEGFGGTLDDLTAVQNAVNIPVLIKDFILSPVQVVEARVFGADIVLLIVAALRQNELESLHTMVMQLGMTPLVEVHDEHELQVALDLGAQLVGVNNRNLHTFEVDLELSEKLATQFPPNVVRVSESGINTPEDLLRMQQAGYDAALVGERLMRAPDPGQALKDLLG